MRSLTDLMGGIFTGTGESSQRTRRTGRRKWRGAVGSSTRDAGEGSGTAGGRRAGRRARRGAPPEEEEEQDASAEEEEEEEEEEEAEEEEEQEQEEEEEEGGEEEDLGVPAVWQRGPSRLLDHPIPVEQRPILRPDGKR